MKWEEITVPDAETLSNEKLEQLGAIVVILIILSILWSKPTVRYAMIGAMILAGVFLVFKQGGAL